MDNQQKQFFDKPAIIPLAIDKFNSFFTHNPYSRGEEKTISCLIHNDDINFVYGFYGLHSDPDTFNRFSRFMSLGYELAKDSKENKLMHMSSTREDVGDYSVALIYKPAKNKETNQSLFLYII